MREWKKCRLGDISTLISERKSISYATLGNYISTENMLSDFGGVTAAEKLPIATSVNSYSKGDTLFSNIRTYFKKVWFSHFDGTVSPDVLVFRAVQGKCLDKFLYYSFCNPDFTEFSVLTSKGAKMPRGDKDALLNYYISLPSLPEQSAIAYVLTSLDDKIDLLKRQNATLEKMAETLFRQWFVEEVKEGWREVKLKSITDIAIGRTPPRKESHWFSEKESDIKWISIKDLGNDGVFISTTAEFLTREAIKAFNIPVIPKDTVVLSFKMTVGRVAITSQEMTSNEAIAHFKFHSKTPITKEFLYLFLKTFKYDSLGSTSSIVTAINSAMIKDLDIIIPDIETMNTFKAQTEPYFNKIRSNQTQIRTISALRDVLLPKLMSGEVRVKM